MQILKIIEYLYIQQTRVLPERRNCDKSLGNFWRLPNGKEEFIDQK
jgi:hypothetical protein